jgi:hypothetical protein
MSKGMKSPDAGTAEKKHRKVSVRPLKVILSPDDIAPVFLGGDPGTDYPVIRLDGSTVEGVSFRFYKKLRAFVLIQKSNG